jgi:hypothetical protein
MQSLPFRPGPSLARLLGGASAAVSVIDSDAAGPRLKGVLSKPASRNVSFDVRVHGSNGVPVATASVELGQGDQVFETRHLVFLGMEGYAHLPAAQRQAIETRVWVRRAFVSGTLREGRRSVDSSLRHDS